MPSQFVLDHNFPYQASLIEWPEEIRVIALKDVDSDLTQRHDDWEVLRSLDQRNSFDGFITNDAKMLKLSREMVTLSDSRLLVIVTEGVGQHPVRAAGLLLTHLFEIARRVPERPRIFVLRPANLESRTPGQAINSIAVRQKIPPNQLITLERDAMQQYFQAKPNQ